MRKSVGSTRQTRSVDTQTWIFYLRERYPRDTAKHVARDIAFSPGTVGKWLTGQTLPSFAATLALVSAYGAEFLAVCLPASAWLDTAARQVRIARAQAEIERLHGELAALGGVPR